MNKGPEVSSNDFSVLSQYVVSQVEHPKKEKKEFSCTIVKEKRSGETLSLFISLDLPVKIISKYQILNIYISEYQ